MKKNLKIACVIILLVALILPITYSYAIAMTEQPAKEKQFFEISKLEVTKNEKIEMTLNLDVVKYNEFVFELKSDEVIEDVEISQNDSIETEKNNHEIVMDINKENTNINTVNLSYTIPEDKKVGDTIKFVATITGISTNETDIDKNEDEITTEIEQDDESKEIVDNEETVNNIDSVVDNTEQKQETQSVEFEVKIIEEQDENQKENNEQQTQLPNTENTKDNERPNSDDTSSNESKETMQNSSSNSSNMGAVSQSSNNGQVEEVVTYNGSDNNYLSKLSVKNYSLNKDFSKENTTYFVTVESETEKLNITLQAEDDAAIVCVYGNENLKEGINKILISVTAENGNVRNYRIYVTKNA